MEKLNSYLQELLNKCGHELRLEPNKNPYIITTNGNMDVSPTTLPGAQINSMIFELIPNDVKQKLPNQPEVEFVHPHNLGAFSFCVKKSPAGFNVTIRPATDEERNAMPKFEEPAESEEVHQSTQPEESYEAAEPESGSVEDASQSEVDAALEGNGFMDTAEEYKLESNEDSASEAGDSSSSEFEPDEFPGSNSAVDSDFGDRPVDVASEASTEEYEIEYSEDSVAEAYGEFDQPSQQFEQTVNPGNAVPLEELPVEYSKAEIIDAAKSAVGQETEMNSTQPTPSAQDTGSQISGVSSPTTFTPAHTNARSEMDAFFVQMADEGASDLHLSVTMPPLIRKDGKMRELSPDHSRISAEAMERLLTSIMPEHNQLEFKERNDTDFAYEIRGLARFRANIFRDRKGMGGVFRIIPSNIMTAEDLDLPKAIMKLCELSKGLVVVTGPTGSGKSTTLCAMVDSINRNREDHIITIEDPIEFTHENQKCLVNQREVHNHTNSFKNALRAALREDPDILLVGEMRDLETISIAIETAETGHLVFGTLHTTTAASTVDRIIDQFPADRQQQIRVMLSESLKGVIAQTLLPKIGGGRIAALEVLIVTPAIANLIREGKTFQIASQMQTGKNIGMQMLNDSLMDLVEKGLVEPKDAYIKSVDKDHFETLLKRAGKKV